MNGSSYEDGFAEGIALKEQFLATIRSFHAKVLVLGDTDRLEYTNTLLFLMKVILDADVIIRGWIDARFAHQKRFYVSQSALLLHESAEDYQHLIGGTLRKKLRALSVPGQWEQDLNSTLKLFSKMRDKQSDGLKRIRDAAAAHYDHDAERQFLILEGINQNYMIDLLIDHVNHTQRLVSLLMPLQNSVFSGMLVNGNRI
jgi:hypothetical protein